MLRVFAFDRLGVVLADLYFQDPRPEPGQEGAERGVRVELRWMEAGEPRGSIYAARPIALGDPIWRVDLLESVDGPPGSFDRAHHHPRFTDWEPGRRRFVPELSADPVGWFAERLGDLATVLAEAGVDPAEVGPHDVEEIRAAVPEIVAGLRDLLDGVHQGRLARPLADAGEATRLSWL
ncbi:MAG: hypothetical protein ACKOA9_02340 [Actinomycetota bacterium]